MSSDELAYEEVLSRVADLAEELTAWADPEVSGRAGELLDWVDAFHRDGLGRLVDMIRQWRGEIFLEAVAADPIAGVMLEAYGLGASDEVQSEAEGAVASALEDVRPMIESHGGAIEVDEVVDGVVRVRLSGTCDGCPSSQATLTYGVESALREHWPMFRRLEVLDPATEVDPSKSSLTCGVPLPAGQLRPAGSSAELPPVPVKLRHR
ncbi:MAG: NifU family protein [Acidimicrobiales bacterium]